jgi:hypothetical protein
MALGGYLLPAVSDDLLIASPVPTGGRSPDEVRREAMFASRNRRRCQRGYASRVS